MFDTKEERNWEILLSRLDYYPCLCSSLATTFLGMILLSPDMPQHTASRAVTQTYLVWNHPLSAITPFVYWRANQKFAQLCLGLPFNILAVNLQGCLFDVVFAGIYITDNRIALTSGEESTFNQNKGWSFSGLSWQVGDFREGLHSDFLMAFTYWISILFFPVGCLLIAEYLPFAPNHYLIY